MDDDAPGLAFFNSLSGTLEITLDPPAQPISPRMLGVPVAAPTARIVMLSLRLEVIEDEEEDVVRALAEEELAIVVLRAPSIRILGERARAATEHFAPDGAAFTVRDLIAAIELNELRSRPETEWFGGIDVHHVYFEGMFQNDDGTWSVPWGS